MFNKALNGFSAFSELIVNQLFDPIEFKRHSKMSRCIVPVAPGFNAL